MVPQIQLNATARVSPLKDFADSGTVFKPYLASLKEPLQEKEDIYSEFLYKGPTSQIVEKGNGASQVIDVTAAKYAEKPSRQYAELVFQRNMKEIPSLLEQLKANLQNPEGAKFMQWFREKLHRVWEVADALPKEKVLFLSALEETVRAKRWRDLAAGQVHILEQVVKQTESGTLNLTGALRTLHRNFIDIYPSASIDENDENE
ncbi:MAG: hypothetical protein AB1442_05060 [Nitrospirota bacterium]